MSNHSLSYDYLIVGAGLYGATWAYLAKQAGLKVLVLDKRPHIAGNCYTQNEHGIEVHKYGPHIFHTDDENVWEFVNRFSDFYSYKHKVLARTGEDFYQFPINLSTIHKVYPNLNGSVERELQCYFPDTVDDRNFESHLISKVGLKMYGMFYKGYSAKQWGCDPSSIPADIAKRTSIRFDDNDQYFTDRYQGVPAKGYTGLIGGMLEDIEVRLGVDYLQSQDYFDSLADRVIYTGEIDRYFDYYHGALQYRSLRFEDTLISGSGFFQPVAQVNYPEFSVPYTRIVEHKHFTRGFVPSPDCTVITKEFSYTPDRGEDKYYPVGTEADLGILDKYKQMAKAVAPNVIFGGRLGEYKYYDMDKTIASAMVKFHAVSRNNHVFAKAVS